MARMFHTSVWFHSIKAIVVLALLAAVGCAAGDLQPSPAGSREAGQEELRILWQNSGTYSRIGRTTRVVARDRATLAQIPIAEIPVDFETQMVLVIGLGPTPTNEIAVRIARVWQDGPRIRVQERRVHPGVGSSPGFEPASPWTVAVVPRSDLNVEGFATRVPPGTLKEHPGAR